MKSSPVRAFILRAAMDERSDAAFVIETLAGRKESFAVLVRRYQGHAYGTAVGLLGDYEQAKDVVQEAFLLAYRELAKLKQPARFGGWLRGIVRNRAHRILRKAPREKQWIEGEDGAVERASGCPRPDQVAEGSELRGLVRRAVTRLGEKDREAVGLFYADGLSYAEIAEFLGVTEGTVLGRLQRGRAKLRKELAMVAATFEDNAPDEAFAERVAKAVAVYTAKGPDGDSVGSAWDRRNHAMIGELLNSGDEGFRVATELSSSERARVRRWAALYFGLARDPRGTHHLARLLKDTNAEVRRMALRWYPRLIDPNAGGWWNPERPAESIAPGLQEIFPFLGDLNVKTRWTVLRILRCYAHLGDARIERALHRALTDPKHKVRHEAARTLRIPCPDCGARFNR